MKGFDILFRGLKSLDYHPFNLYPENWFEGYHVKSTQIFFRRAPWKKLSVILINQKKIRRAPWKNLGRFYRVDFTGYPSNHFSGCRLKGRCLSTTFVQTFHISLIYAFIGRPELLAHKIPILKERICILFFCHSHSHSHSHSALCNVYPVALDRNRR